MGYEQLIRDSIAGIMVPQLASMNITVQHEAWVGDDGRGADEFAAAVARQALLEVKQEQVYTRSGTLATSMATLIFLSTIEDTTPNTGKQRLQPVDPRDRITLPDGTVAPIIDAAGFIDSGTERPFVNEVKLGFIGSMQR